MNNEQNKRDNVRFAKIDSETEQLKRVLQRAVASEPVPDELRARISRMIRETE